MTTLSIRARLLVALGAALLLVLYMVPLWRIDLLAPQYPEGLGMLIRIDTITGIAPSDLDNINGLNHYIGMKAIRPEAIPVLRYMPWVVGALSLTGLLAAASGRRRAVMAWIAAFAIAGAAGLFEFYRWSYDYGHNLAADAVIKVPGMSYQPPLIGSKQLLNFTASSWPDVGGVLAGVAFLLGVVALVPFVSRGRGRITGYGGNAHAAAAVVAVMTMLGAAGCTRAAGPVPIAYGLADCDVCRMRIGDQRYGGEYVMGTGKVRQFDSIECLAGYVASLGVAASGGAAYVSDFEHPGHLLPVANVLFVRRGAGSPMRAGLLAVAAGADSATLGARFGGSVLTWREVRDLAARGALRPASDPPTTGRGA